MDDKDMNQAGCFTKKVAFLVLKVELEESSGSCLRISGCVRAGYLVESHFKKKKWINKINHLLDLDF